LGHSTFTLTLDVYGDYIPRRTVRELHGGRGADIATLSLDTVERTYAPAAVADVVALLLRGHRN
jgi:hypothetical protein